MILGKAPALALSRRGALSNTRLPSRCLASTTAVSAGGIEDPAAYCKDLVRKQDYEGYLVSQFYPRSRLNGYLALRAFYVELATQQDAVSNAMIGKMRMQFWRDAVQGIANGRPPHHPIALALSDASKTARLAPYHLKRIVDARDQELDNPTHLAVDSLLAHAESTASTFFYLLLSLLNLSSETYTHAASHLGVASSLATLLRALPYHASKGRMVIPAEITARHGVSQEDVFRKGHNAAGIDQAVFEFATLANDHLLTARSMFKETGGKVPKEAMPVFACGGTAGTALAARLTEDPNITVCMVEAGEYVTDLSSINVTGMVTMALRNRRVDWTFYTVPQNGKLVGGSSALNYMAWGRASSEEYDALEALSNPGWNWKEFLPYLMKVESAIPPSPELVKAYNTGEASPQYHGQTGPIKTSFAHWYNDLHQPFLESITNLGVPLNPNVGSGSTYGTYTGAYCIDPETSTRSFAATGYYAPNAHRKNLVLLPQAQVSRIVMEPRPDGLLVAKGVKYKKDYERLTVYAGREVILAAGSYQTPQLLELSGIGKRDVLEKHGIDQILDLNVGENLLSKEYETYDGLANPEFLNEQVQPYQEKKRGMLFSAFSAFSFVPLEIAYGSAKEHGEFRNRLSSDTSLSANESERKQFKFLKDWLSHPKRGHVEALQNPGFFSINRNFKPEAGKHYNTVMVGCLQPLSRGSVHTTSADPFSAPAIDPAYLKNPADVDVLVAGIKFCRRVIETKPLSDAQRGAYDPAASLHTDEELAEFVRAKTESFNHPLGTAAMLPREDRGIVDSNLKVYGTQNLQVADASIIPFMLSVHIQATVYAIAEKVPADVIKAAHAVH
ncbi:hypothetical protein EWM64_g2815 [Hericium alpestre]|uniref:Glucose-methanol-choline oxidoreductase N-terminal domain-containing protein n=1 Tax=Hericium alpestre TaxID=135208 RepID=A0A4Z0A4E4_9AGAM|nr:hypothetical protein EWM64_g2815 [Hericium alpestre]